MSEPGAEANDGAVRFLSVENVLQIHQDTINEEGGSAGLRDSGLLDSAVAMPMATMFGEYLHAGLSGKAAAYLFHLCQNHPFVDGNKRTAALALLLFLVWNGVPEEALPPPDDLERVTMAVANQEMGKVDVTSWLVAQGIQ